jgi:hypothetical protein
MGFLYVFFSLRKTLPKDLFRQTHVSVKYEALFVQVLHSVKSYLGTKWQLSLAVSFETRYKQINEADREDREVEATGAITKEWRNQTPASVGAKTRVQWRHTYGYRPRPTKRSLLHKCWTNFLY